LLGASLEKPSAPHCEERIADEGDVLLIKNERDMAERVPWHFDDPADMLAQANLVAFAECDVAARDVFRGRTGDARAGGFLDR
jgi:hypothetical protein